MSDLQRARKRLFTMLGVDLACAAIAIAALAGAFVSGRDELFWLFGAALAGGFGAQIWFIAGFRRAKEGV